MAVLHGNVVDVVLVCRVDIAPFDVEIRALVGLECFVRGGIARDTPHSLNNTAWKGRVKRSDSHVYVLVM